MSAADPMPMPYGGRDVPHVVIEVNQKCNISCAACYKDKSSYTKPLAQVLEEIDQAARERNLSMVSLAGGEPSLHPQLEQIIAHAAGKGLTVQMLSNGYSLTEEQLRRYEAAGLHKVYLHIDAHQRRPDARGVTSERDLDPLREEIAARVRRAGLHCALSLTLYRDRLEEVTDVVSFVLGSPAYDRLLVTCCTDFQAIARAFGRTAAVPEQSGHGELDGQSVTNAQVEALLRDRLGMVPFGAIGSSKDENARRWILYMSFVIHFPDGSWRPLHVGPRIRRLVEAAYAAAHRRTGRYPFGNVMSSGRAAATCLLYAATSGSPRIMAETAAFLARLARKGAVLRQKCFVFQQGPSVTADGDIEWCKDCPDATVRDGRLVPVCMADFMTPLGTGVEPAASPLPLQPLGSAGLAPARGRALPRAEQLPAHAGA